MDDYLAEFWKKVFTEPDGARRRRRAHPAASWPSRCARRTRSCARPSTRASGSTARATRSETRSSGAISTNVKYAKNAASEAERKKFLAVVELFQKYGEQYNVDYLLMAAQGYQESPLDQNAKSPVGAIGVMQVMPATGKELKVGDITQIEPNIHAGVKYMRFMMDQYFKDEPMDDLNKGLLTFASYNAGPGRIRQLRREAEKRGLDPNVWFGNVERVASERIGRETVTYVSNIYKYYVAYKLVMEQRGTTRRGEGAGREGTVRTVENTDEVNEFAGTARDVGHRRTRDGHAGAAQSVNPGVVVCGSKAGERQTCAADTTKGVTLAKSTGTVACMLGTNWGIDEKSIWVRDGCSAEFSLGAKAPTGPGFGAYTPAVPRQPRSEFLRGTRKPKAMLVAVLFESNVS